jgi:uncharacterized protein YrrD
LDCEPGAISPSKGKNARRRTGGAMDVKSLKGIAVVSIAQGEKVGTVDNILFDLENRRVIAFKLTKPGLLRSGGIVLRMTDVENIGKDAVMIKNKEAIRELKAERDLQSRPDLGTLSALRVVSEDGTFVGNVATVQFEPRNGVITDVEITGTGFMDRLRRNQTVPAHQVLSFGSDVVVVPDKYAPTRAANNESDEPVALPDKSGPDNENDRIRS